MMRSWGLGGLVTGLLASVVGIVAAADSEPTPTVLNASLTSNRGGTPTQPVCCFVFQDTVTEVWAELYSTATYYGIVNLTSYTVRVTPGPNTAETNIETNVFTTNATFSTRLSVGGNPLSLYNNVAPRPSQTETSYTSSQLVTHGVTVPSPQAVYIYSSVKIITALPVTDSAGNLVCATPTKILDGVITANSNAQAFYYGLTDLSYFGTRVDSVETFTNTYTVTSNPTVTGGPPLVSVETFTSTSSAVESFLVNSKNESLSVPITRPTGIMVTLETPFVYQPAAGATGSVHVGFGNCDLGGDSVGWGYPPQTLLDYMVQNPAVSKQYPGLESCFPAGPSIITSKLCASVAPVFQFAGGDLTESTILTVTQPGVFVPATTGAEPEPTLAPPASVTTSAASPLQTDDAPGAATTLDEPNGSSPGTQASAAQPSSSSVDSSAAPANTAVAGTLRLSSVFWAVFGVVCVLVL